MAIVVEDGTGVTGGNSYIDQDGFEAYAEMHGFDISGKDDDAIEAAIIRAASWLDSNYRDRLPGVRTFGSMYALQWPRKAGSLQYGQYVPDRYMTTITDAEGVPIATTEIPLALKNAQAEATYRELSSPGSLAPDLERGGAIHRLQAGSVEIEYANTAPNTTTFCTIDGIMASIIGGVGGTSYTAQAVRA